MLFRRKLNQEGLLALAKLADVINGAIAGSIQNGAMQYKGSDIDLRNASEQHAMQQEFRKTMEAAARIWTDKPGPVIAYLAGVLDSASRDGSDRYRIAAAMVVMHLFKLEIFSTGALQFLHDKKVRQMALVLLAAVHAGLRELFLNETEPDDGLGLTTADCHVNEILAAFPSVGQLQEQLFPL